MTNTHLYYMNYNWPDASSDDLQFILAYNSLILNNMQFV